MRKYDLNNIQNNPREKKKVNNSTQKKHTIIHAKLAINIQESDCEIFLRNLLTYQLSVEQQSKVTLEY